MNEHQTRLKRLIYRANHRGIKEMDIILGRFANEKLNDLSADELNSFENLMEEHDRDLILWFTNEVEFPHNELRPVFVMVSEHMSNRFSKSEY